MKKLLLLCFTLAIFNSKAQFLTTSTLPIIVINTNGFQITDEPKIKTDFKIYFNGFGKTNSVNDKPHYDGFAGIEYRGSSSQTFPKKGLGIELWNDKSESIEFPFLGMPKESDWILFASYNEKSFMHNVLTMRVARAMGLYASRTEYVEVVINNVYMGVYVFMEKIKRSEGRVDIAKLKETDISGDDITGGYIFKADKTTGSTLGSWRSKFPNYNAPNNFTTFLYEYPKTITAEQRAYLRNYVDKAETALQADNYRDKTDGYRKYIDTRSFIQLFLLNEVSKNVDGYRISTFFYKDKDSKGGKIKAGPPWDYDITYGNANYCEGDSPYGFSYRFNYVCPTDFWQVPFWWERMLGDSAFVKELGQEYGFHRKYGALRDSYLKQQIDSLASALQEPIKRNFQKWPILGTYVWPQPSPYAGSWEQEVIELQNFLTQRLQWLDNNIKTDFAITDSEPALTEMNIRAFPNPFLERININIQSQYAEKASIKLIDMLGNIIFEGNEFLKIGDNEFHIELPENDIVSGEKILIIESNNKRISKKLVHQ
ncbi:Spore coat protein CotH [Emticicia oligotrophica DSM 17448]|uniref:Spore coat protein CotH n=1 Tax=Emticicia oligotrophica (strain DSM 17448 / CIP 109782 / MTCC 6937 / GPTSA100-15) TaxID=929562 RepID=A0ABM5N658_EMTOG|nr:CotH kinase family protein [Emticicia oligotrophica]AFK04827.1 Spore coat protein CotH [Emticicia oligotrophica DSM 17448]